MEKGDEGLAREALSRRKGYDVSLMLKTTLVAFRHFSSLDCR